MWLSIRLYFISVTIIGAVCVISILQCKFSIANSGNDFSCTLIEHAFFSVLLAEFHKGEL